MSRGVVISAVLGLARLIAGAELPVRGASRPALRCGIPALAVGLTVAASGTSSPELAVSVQAGLAGPSGIAAGNVAGSHLFNILGSAASRAGRGRCGPAVTLRTCHVSSGHRRRTTRGRSAAERCPVSCCR